jgi:hypothetical protein
VQLEGRPFHCGLLLETRVLEHKQELFVFLKQKWADLFGADFEVLRYDLTSTYFEGAMEQNTKARRGCSRDGRPGCLIETTYGKARRVRVMDRGIPSEAILKEMREPERQTFYLVGKLVEFQNRHKSHF